MCGTSASADRLLVVHEARVAADELVERFLRLPVAKAMNLRTRAGFDRAVALLAAQLRRATGRADVEGEAGVMLGEAGRGVDLQDLRNFQPARALPLEDAKLVGVAAIAGNRLQHDAVGHRRRLHPRPRAGGVLAQPERAAPAVEAGQRQPVGFGDQRQTARIRVSLGIQPELLQPCRQRVHRQIN